MLKQTVLFVRLFNHNYISVSMNVFIVVLLQKGAYLFDFSLTVINIIQVFLNCAIHFLGYCVFVFTNFLFIS